MASNVIPESNGAYNNTCLIFKGEEYYYWKKNMKISYNFHTVLPLVLLLYHDNK